MVLPREPLVTVVTTVYNGEKYLAQSIESVLRQTYTNWEYIIVNNCSTDASRSIAQHYADRDRRIRIRDNTAFVGVLVNYNNGFRQVSPQSSYFKIVDADDWLFPECLARMVDLAEQYPSVGMVGSYALCGVKVHQDGLPFSSQVLSGRELCRNTLLGGPNVFGSTSSLLYRSDVVREMNPFYNEANIHADTESCYAALQRWDFGFVHQVLVFHREHEESVSSSFSEKVQSHLAGHLLNVKKYGALYLDPDEYRQTLAERTSEYYAFLAKSAWLLRDGDFWKYHIEALQQSGCPFSARTLTVAILAEGLDMVRHPVTTLRKCVRWVWSGRLFRTRKFRSQLARRDVAVGN